MVQLNLAVRAIQVGLTSARWRGNIMERPKCVVAEEGLARDAQRGESGESSPPSFSGAGKTTLLSTVSCRASGFERSGELLVNGRPISNDHMISLSGFMPQQDVTVEQLTVLEHMQFMAWLKMDVWVSDERRRFVVRNSILDMGLQKCKNSQLRFLSGGERAKVSLAVQLLTDPPVLFCDEPTTGLDSFNASNIVSKLSELAKKGKTVVCIIHQPASGILETFDEVILMATGGRVAYQGAVNDSLDHFKSLGMDSPKTFNTAELLISHISVRENFKTEEDIAQLCDRFITSKTYKIFEEKFDLVHTADSDGCKVHEIDEQFLKWSTTRRKSNLIRQFKLLFWRQGLSMVRNIKDTLVKLMLLILTGCLIAISFRGAIFDRNAVQNLEGLFVFMITDITYHQSYQALSVFQVEIPILLRETKENTYSVGPYYLSRIVFVVLQCLIDTLTYSVTIFLITGFNESAIAFIVRFFTPVFACGLASTAIGCCLSSIFKSMGTVFLWIVPINDISYMFSGMFLHVSSLPIYLQWLKYISRMYYGAEALSILQWTVIANIPCPEHPGVKCLASPDQVLDKYGYQSSNIRLDFIGLGLMFLILNIIGFLGLKSRSTQQASY